MDPPTFDEPPPGDPLFGDSLSSGPFDPDPSDDPGFPPTPLLDWPPEPPAFPRDPLALDLDGDGVELISLEDSSAHFDFGEDGFAERIGWLKPQPNLAPRCA